MAECRIMTANEARKLLTEHDYHIGRLNGVSEMDVVRRVAVGWTVERAITQQYGRKVRPLQSQQIVRQIIVPIQKPIPSMFEEMRSYMFKLTLVVAVALLTSIWI